MHSKKRIPLNKIVKFLETCPVFDIIEVDEAKDKKDHGFDKVSTPGFQTEMVSDSDSVSALSDQISELSTADETK